MRVIFSEIAKLELDDAVSFYELEFEGLGKRFKNETRSSINCLFLSSFTLYL